MSLLRRRMMLAAHGGDLPVTNPKLVYTPNTYMNRGGTAPTYEFAFDGLGSTEYYEINSGETFVYYNPSANTTGATPHTLIFNAYKQQTDYWNCYFGSARTITASNFSGKGFFKKGTLFCGMLPTFLLKRRKQCFLFRSFSKIRIFHSHKFCI